MLLSAVVYYISTLGMKSTDKNSKYEKVEADESITIETEIEMHDISLKDNVES